MSDKHERLIEEAYCRMFRENRLGTVILTEEGRIPDELKNSMTYSGFRDGFLGVPRFTDIIKEKNKDPMAAVLYDMAYERAQNYRAR